MNQRRGVSYLVGLVAVTAVISVLVLVVGGHRPFLGLDLQGGVSVVLRAKAPDAAEATQSVVDTLQADTAVLGLGEVTVTPGADTVTITPTAEVTDDQLDAAATTAESVLEGSAAAEISARRAGKTVVVDVDTGTVPDDSIDQAIEIIRTRVDSLGVAEPEITRQGKNVVVQIPGIDDADEALELVGRTAELRFRPVLSALDEATASAPSSSTTAAPTTASTAATGSSDSTATTVAGDTTTSTAAADGSTTSTSSAPTTSTTAAASDESGAAPVPGRPAPAYGRSGVLPSLRPAPRTQGGGDTTSTTAASATSSSTAAGDSTTTSVDPTATTVDPTATTLDPTATTVTTAAPMPTSPSGFPAVTPDDQDVADATVVLLDEDGLTRYVLGPTLVTGAALSGAQAVIDPNTAQWYVEVTFKGGANGMDLFNAAAASCNPPNPSVCPLGQLGIVLDHRVVSAPVIEAPFFDTNTVTINGGEAGFTEGEARDLALVLRYGALPVELEVQNTVRVSATLGADALDAAILSAIVALVAVTLYMVAFYRLLGLLAVLKLVVEGALLFSLVAFLSETQGLALTLAGITGIIVSIGVSLDSNVVYYEHLKEDVLAGRTLRSTVDRSFAGAFSTIFKADVASLIGAGLLWWLTVGPVRGFAFYLAISTLLDLVCSYFYMHPVVALATRSKLAQRRPSLFGLPGVPTLATDGEAPAVVGSSGRGATTGSGSTTLAESPIGKGRRR